MTWRGILFASLLLLAETGLVGAAETSWSVAYFNSRKAEWDQLLGGTIQLEGRLSLLGSGQLRLSKCDIPFHASEALIRSLQGKKSVEITGRLKKESGKFLFDADRIRVVPTDVEEYESRSAKLRSPRASEWYELADWAAERSRFYDDADLGKRALSAYDKGVSVEWRSLDAEDAEGRFLLAQKVVQYKLANSRRLELIHEGDHILWNGALKTKPFDKEVASKLIAKIAGDLPGCKQPLVPFPEELKSRYDREPLATYRDSPDDIRRQIHRILYVSAVMKLILEDAIKDGRNGDVIADRLEELVPEAAQLAQQYRQRKLNWRLEQSGTATRPEIEQLAADFRARQQPDQARLALTQWLKGRESRLRPDGTLGLMQLADEYLSLLQDEPKAVAFLSEAYKIDPTFADVSEKLKSMEYVNAGGVWIKSNQRGNPPDPAPIPFAVIPGAIAVGMNAAAVRNVMGGAPGSLARAVTKGTVSEIWSYGQRGTSRLIIRLETTSIPPELRVTEINSER